MIWNSILESDFEKDGHLEIEKVGIDFIKSDLDGVSENLTSFRIWLVLVCAFLTWTSERYTNRFDPYQTTVDDTFDES